jgi:NitT/TauT family transport system ATP-binding protein
MSARPGRMVSVVDVPLPRPRTLDMMRSHVFFDCVNRVRDGLFGKEESINAVSRPEAAEAY